VLDTQPVAPNFLNPTPTYREFTMGLRVNTNLFSINAQRNLSNITNRLAGNFSRLASGLRIANASDDAAGLGISERMRSQIRSLGAASRNAQDGVSLAQTAEGALNEVSSNLTRMRELAVQSANGTLNTGDRSTIDDEFQALATEIERIADTTTFNGLSLLNASTALDIQVGINQGDTISVDLEDVQLAALGLTTTAVDTASAASAAFADLDTAINTVNSSRGDLGAMQNRLQSAIRSIQSSKENLSASESRIRDVDIASETADLTRNSIMQQAATSVLAQANAQPQLALSLLQG
jgi:flagellin